MSGKHELILGGARSGKSGFAARQAGESGLDVTVIVTATAGDIEMEERIRRHRLERPANWRTVEEPLMLASALTAEAAENRCIIVDCLTMWLSNLLADSDDLLLNCLDAEELPLFREQRTHLLQILPTLPGKILLVANEVGLGLVPTTPLGRLYRDEAGRLNQALANLCQRVNFIAAGLPLRLKG